MAPSSSFCSKCGGVNPPDAAACFACGEALSNPSATSQDSSGDDTHRSPAGALKFGALLGQHYQILEQIGEGGFGAVYKASDTQLGNRQVAIKEMSLNGLEAGELQEATEAFHREALLLADLAHPSLPRIYDHFSVGGRWYLVMEFIQGETLEAHLAKAANGRLPVKEVLQVGLRLCAVLEYLHTRQPPIIFRDLKPSNVLLTPDGAVYLIDFGIARHFKPGQQKDTMAFGSPGYAAPEQYGKAQTTPRSDIYSLGAVLHHLLSGKDPSDTPFRFAPMESAWPTDLWPIIRPMVELDESRRPVTVAAVRRDLERLALALERGDQQSAATSKKTALLPTVTLAPVVSPTVASPKAVPVGRALKQPSRWTIRRLSLLFSWIPILLCLVLSWFLASGSSPPNISSYPPPNSATAPAVYATAWAPDGRRIASGGANSTVAIWDPMTGKPLLTHYQGGAVQWLAWSPDGAHIASASTDRTAQVWDTSTGATITTYRGHTARVSELAWSPDGKQIASASDDQTVQIWEAATGKRSFNYRAFTDEVWTVAWSPDGKYLAAGSKDQLVRVWDAVTGTTRLVYSEHTQGIEHLTWSPDSTRIASASEDTTVQVWDAASGSRLVTYHGHTRRVAAVAWAPDGQLLASGGDDGTAQVWRADTGSLVATSNGHTTGVWVVAWAPDSARLASASLDGTVYLWYALNGKPILTYHSQP